MKGNSDSQWPHSPALQLQENLADSRTQTSPKSKPLRAHRGNKSLPMGLEPHLTADLIGERLKFPECQRKAIHLKTGWHLFQGSNTMTLIQRTATSFTAPIAILPTLARWSWCSYNPLYKIISREDSKSFLPAAKTGKIVTALHING